MHSNKTHLPASSVSAIGFQSAARGCFGEFAEMFSVSRNASASRTLIGGRRIEAGMWMTGMGTERPGVPFP